MSTRKIESIRHIQEKPEVDQSIKGYDYVEYQPISGSQLNMSWQITITIENTDDFFYPRHCCMWVEGNLVKAAGEARYIGAVLITLTNNAIMYLFTNIKCCLGGMEIESLNHPGFSTTMHGQAKDSLDKAKGPGHMQCWYLDTSTVAAENNVGFAAWHTFIVKKQDPQDSFSFAIPTNHIFGFWEDYDKVMYGLKHTLVRISENDAMFKAAAADAGKVKLSKIS